MPIPCHSKMQGLLLAGSFKMGGGKGGAYLLDATTLACSLLFVPIQDDGRSVIPIDDRISILFLWGCGSFKALINSIAN